MSEKVRKRKYTYEEVKEIVEKDEKNRLISETYINNKTKLDICCGCGDVYSVALSEFLNGKNTCNKCSVSQGKYVRTNYNNIKEEVECLGYVLLTNSSEYNGATSPILFKDKDRYLYYTSITNLRKTGKSKLVGKHNPYSIQNIKQYIKNNNISTELLSTEYVNNTKNLIFKCNRCECEFECNWANFQTRHTIYCNICSPIVSGENKRNDWRKIVEEDTNYEYSLIKEFDKSYNGLRRIFLLVKHNVCNSEPYEIGASRFKEGSRCAICRLEENDNQTNNDIISGFKEYSKGEYECINCEKSGHDRMLTLVDSVGYKYEIRLSNFKNGDRPRFVSKVNPYTIQNIKKFIAINNLNTKLISSKYFDNTSPLIFTCDTCGENFECSWDTFTRDSVYKTHCNACGTTKYAEKRLHDIDFVKNQFKTHGYIPLFDEYNGCEKDLKIQDSNGYIYEITYSSFSSGCRPLAISTYNKYTIQNIKHMSKIEKWNSEILFTDWSGTDSEYMFKCSCDNKYVMSWNTFIQRENKVCRVCARSISILECKVQDFLEYEGISYEREKIFDNCKDVGYLRFDFYLTHYNICIEADGKQHFEPVRFGGIDIEDAKRNFKNTCKKDKIKNEYCMKNGIKLIRIPYWEFNDDSYIDRLNRELGKCDIIQKQCI